MGKPGRPRKPGKRGPKKQPPQSTKKMAKGMAYWLRRDGQTYEEVARKIKEAFGWEITRQTICTWFNSDGTLKDEHQTKAVPMKRVENLEEIPGFVTLDIDTVDWEREFKQVLAGHIEVAKFCFTMARMVDEPKDRAVWGNAAAPHTAAISKLLGVLTVHNNNKQEKVDDPMQEYLDGFKRNEAEE